MAWYLSSRFLSSVTDPGALPQSSYRVGIPGFLCSPEMQSAGYEANNGLHDQRLALSWTRQHIGGFGGDETRVTFLGESAGASEKISIPGLYTALLMA